MHILPLAIEGVVIIEPRVFRDDRGYLFESFNNRAFDEAIGKHTTFVQDNHSYSTKHVLRGLHYQIQQTQGKLVRVIAGEVFDVAVDLRLQSATFGQWVAHRLSAENHLQMWIPPGFAHGFLVLSASADFLYKTTEYWHPELERSVLWSDGDLNIDWPLGELKNHQPILAAKDAQAPGSREVLASMTTAG